MDAKEELVYREYINREEMHLHAPYLPELAFYAAIRDGEVARVKKICREPFTEKKGLGVLSQNPLQNLKYHFVITTAMVARYCIEGGMNVEEAYTLSDFYIQKADTCDRTAGLLELHRKMCLDYAQRMKEHKEKQVDSPYIIACLEYIYNHLHERITLQRLAQAVGLSSAYLSRLFCQQTGCSVTEYIRQKKVQTAQNMLLYSRYSPAEIAVTLAFPSQSYFTEVFRKYVGVTPVKYRQLHYREMKLE